MARQRRYSRGFARNLLMVEYQIMLQNTWPLASQDKKW